jgi:hypothetical protein
LDEKKIEAMLREIQVNVFCYGKIVFPKTFYKLTDLEKAEVVRRIKSGAFEGGF